MEGFAAAAMIRLVRAGLEAQNLPLPPLPRSADARVPIDAKRQALGEIARRHGVPALLRIPEVLPRLPPGPALSALRLARDPDDLLDRWHRLERFAHSRHRIAVERSAPGDLVLVHRSLDPASGPTAQEDVLVFALITVLCEWSGATALEAGPIDADERWRRDGRWTEDLAGDVRRGWRIRHAPGRRRWPEEPAISDGGDPGVRLRDAVAADPAARWTVDRLAAAAGIGLRSLQRRLAAAGTTPNRLVAETRLAAAAEFLVAGDAGLAEIGFACGFADQPRFTRTFRRYAGLTPAAYRTAFAAGGEQAPLTDPDRRTARRARPRPRRGVTGR